METDWVKWLTEANNELKNTSVRAEDEGVAEMATPAMPGAVDMYDLLSRQRMGENKKQRPNGANPKIATEVEYIAKNRLSRAYSMAKEKASVMAKNGDTARARMVQDQYMTDVFLPTIEAIVHIVPPDEFSNAVDALSIMDKYVLTQGGASNGYTRAFVQQMYSSELGTTAPRSDSQVADSVRKIRSLVSDGQIRTAVGIANKMRKAVDSGQHSASDDDYEILLKVSERGQ